MSRRAPVAPRESAQTKPVETAPPAIERGYRDLLPWLLLFAGSGCAALIYEIVWFQLLQLVIGSSAVSLGLLLTAYMGGLCLGSALLPWLVSRRHHPMRVYALLELGVAAFGIIALFAVPLIARIYVAGAGTGLAGLVLRGVISAVCLLPPTLLMGASLPAIARWVETTPRGVSWLGLLYSANVAGAVGGCVLAGFYLLRVHDMGYATYTAAAINVAVALLALALAHRAGNWSTPNPDERGVSVTRAPGAIFIYAAIAFSGLTALGAEVVGRACSRCCWAPRSTRSRSFWPCFLPGCGLAAALVRSSRGARAIRAWRWRCARFCWPLQSPGPPSRSRMCCPGGPSIRGSRRIHGSISIWI